MTAAANRKPRSRIRAGGSECQHQVSGSRPPTPCPGGHLPVEPFMSVRAVRVCVSVRLRSFSFGFHRGRTAAFIGAHRARARVRGVFLSDRVTIKTRSYEAPVRHGAARTPSQPGKARDRSPAFALFNTSSVTSRGFEGQALNKVITYISGQLLMNSGRKVSLVKSH